MCHSIIVLFIADSCVVRGVGGHTLVFPFRVVRFSVICLSICLLSVCFRLFLFSDPVPCFSVSFPSDVQIPRRVLVLLRLVSFFSAIPRASAPALHLM
jgi:hypothetical protein